MVKDAAVPVDQFCVGGTPILNLPIKAKNMGEYVGNPDRVERAVRVEWIKTVPKDQAIWEPGMFANQNSACKLRNKFTLERLIVAFGLDK
jgi:hypothetical protein